MLKIREKIKNWLFKEEIQRINSLEKEIDNAVNRFRVASIQLSDSKKELEECRKIITQVCDIGVDVGFTNNEHSWAVICVAGKPEYVKFMPLNSQDTRTVINFLKQFQYSRHIIDSPIAFREMIKGRIISNNKLYS